jgi:hypothetical protein
MRITRKRYPVTLPDIPFLRAAYQNIAKFSLLWSEHTESCFSLRELCLLTVSMFTRLIFHRITT